MSDIKQGQVELQGVVKSVEQKAYGDGKSMTIIRIECAGYEGTVKPFEVKAFKVQFDAKEGDKVVLLCWVSGKYGSGTYAGRVFMDLTLADWGYVEPSGTKETPVDAPKEEDAALPF